MAAARSKGAQILETIGMPVTRYYQLLNDLIDRPEALAFDPALVTRLRRQRSRRTGSARRARTQAGERARAAGSAYRTGRLAWPRCCAPPAAR